MGHPHREVTEIRCTRLTFLDLLKEFIHGTKQWAALLHILIIRCNTHKPLQTDTGKCIHLHKQLIQILTVNAGFGLLAGKVDLHENVLYLAKLRRSLVDLLRQAQRIHRMNQIELTDGVPHLVRLQMADQMPFHLALQIFRLVQSLLHTVLSNVHNAGINGFPHCLYGMVLRHGNQFHRSLHRHMDAPYTRCRNRRTYLPNPHFNRHIVTHLSSITAASRPVLPPSAR